MKKYQSADFAAMDKRYRTHLINSLSGFKSVNLVGTVNSRGQTNLSVVSSVIHIGADPALMGFIMRPVTVTRDTYNNIFETGYYTFNHIAADFMLKAHQTSARYPVEISEFDAVGLEPAFLDGFPAPYVAESPVRIGLEFRQKLDISLNGTMLMIGEIREIYVPENYVHEDGFLDLEAAGTLTVSGLDCYHRTQKLARLSYAKADRDVRVVE